MAKDFKVNYEHWNIFSSNIRELISVDEFCDVTLISEGKRLPASRIILSAFSQFFKTMFTTGSYKERDCKDVHINDVSFDDLNRLIKFCYTGRLKINSDNSESLLRGAHSLQLETAVSICCKYIQHNLTPENCGRFLLVAKHLMMKEFEEKVFEYCRANFRKIPHSVYVELNALELDECIKNPGLKFDDEREALDIVMNWFQHEPKTRMEHIAKLASWVNLNFIDESYFSKYFDFLSQFREVHEFLKHIIEFYVYPMKNEVSESSVRESTCVPVALSDKGCIRKYKVSSIWFRWALKRINAFKEKYDDVIKTYLNDLNLKYYIVRKKRDCISIVTLDLQNFSCGSSSFNTPYKDADVTFYRQFVYLVGSDRTVCRFNLDEPYIPVIWNTPISVERSHSGVIVLNEKLYVIGGESKVFDCETGSLHYKYTIHASTECFLLQQKTWKNCAPLLHPVSEMGIDTLNGKIYVLGGVTEIRGSGRKIVSFTNRFQCYDPIRDTWTYLCNFASQCHSISFFIWDGMLMTSRATRRSESLIYNCYEPVKDEWNTIGFIGLSAENLFLSIK